MTSNRQRIAARRRGNQTGSQMDSEPVFVVVGRLRRPHGLKGEVLVSVLSDFPERLEPGATLYLGEDHRPLTIAGRRSHNQGLLLYFGELPAREDLEGLQNQMLYVRTDALPALDEGEYYHHQLLGLTVQDEAGAELGRVAEIMQTGANDVYVVRPDEGKDLLLPATSEVILGVDIAAKTIRVRLLPGLSE